MERCFEELQNEIRDEIKYRLDYFDEFESSFVFENSEISVELHLDTDFDGYEYKLKEITFGYFESEVYPYDVLYDNLNIICENLVFCLN